MIEVVETEKRFPTAFLAFNDISMVPYEMKLIDTAALSTREVHFLLLFLNFRIFFFFKLIFVCFRNIGLTNTTLPYDNQ